ncbi:putative DNA-binding WGR domain protein [Planomicrobium soli]|uniref:Putative DNA-binding WGR domain protein n=1 Tax=Planomicrobium soli TaxID=1176648 RepID=A0A2P8H6H6_9BACL|nr:DUF4240 domain-containing protein [Planomicrobium soli]PSL41837.1 putative DNA-binding WGR domain protein [Planomicrobium soli]
MQAHLVYKSSYSNKFWKIAVAKTSYAVTYGRIGTVGTVRAKEFPSPEACKKEAHRLIQSKLKKGYRPAVTIQHEIEESTMTEPYFWQLVAFCKHYSEDPYKQKEWLVSHLSQRSVIDIISFDSFLNEHYSKSYSSNLWAAAYIAMGECSGEGFDSFRAWMLFSGKEVYYRAIEDPESLLPHLKKVKGQETILQVKTLIAAASTAYNVKTGHSYGEYRKLYAQLMAEDFSLPEIDMTWDEDRKNCFSNLFPGLWKAFSKNPL